MAYNPYAYRDNREGVVGKTLKAPYRFAKGAVTTAPAWAPSVLAGQGVRKLAGAYDSAYTRMRSAVGVRRGAYAAMRNDAGVRAAKDTLFYTRRAAANRLPGLNRAVEVATSAVNDTAAMKRAAFENLANVSRQGRALVRQTAAATGEAIEAGSRKLAQTAVRTVGDNSARAATLQQIRVGANRQLSEAVKATGEALRTAKRDTRVARGMFNTALQRKTAAVEAVNKVTAGIRRAESGVGAAINAAQETRRATIAAANSFTKAEKAALGVSGAYKTATGAIRQGAKSLGTSAAQMGKNLLRAVNPFGTAKAIAAEANAAGNAVTTGGKVAKAIGNWAVVKPAQAAGKTVAWTAKAPVKALTKTFGAVEKAGQIITAGNTGKAASIVRGATSAAGLAGSFATQAIIDGAGKAYKFYAEGGKLSDVGAQKITTINGHQVAERNPGWTDVIFSRDYAKEVLKGFQSALTLGLTAQGDGTFWDHTFDKSPEQEAKETAAMVEHAHEQLRDIHGNSVYTAEQIDKINTSLATSAAQSKKAQDFLKRSQGTLDVQNFRKMLGDITSERAAALQRMEDNITNFGEFSKGFRKPITEDEYRQQATFKASKDYDRRLKVLLGNKAAKDVMEENRRSAYALLGEGTGDYDADVKNAAHVESVRSFNQLWTGMSDAERVSWNREDEEKAVSEALAAEEEAA